MTNMSQMHFEQFAFRSGQVRHTPFEPTTFQMNFSQQLLRPTQHDLCLAQTSIFVNEFFFISSAERLLRLGTESYLEEGERQTSGDAEGKEQFSIDI